MRQEPESKSLLSIYIPIFSRIPAFRIRLLFRLLVKYYDVLLANRQTAGIPYPQVKHDDDEQDSAHPPPDRAGRDIFFSAFFFPHCGHSTMLSSLLENTIVSNS
jgi:hypothetical protein